MNTQAIFPVKSAIDIRSVGVVGAGQMGAGIAQVCAVAGFDVWLNDVSEERIDAGLARVDQSIGRLVAKGALEEHAQHESFERLRPASSIESLAQCDLIVEAATESETLKRGIFERICPVLRPDAILATNTSSISITRLAASTDRPGRFIGLHFMNPVPMMKLVEIIRGIDTEETVFQSASSFVTKIGKTATVSEDYPAFTSIASYCR